MGRWSDGLVERGRRRGWHVDGVGDLSRVLRPSGTVRYKPGCQPNLVTIGSCGEWPPLGIDGDPLWRPGPLYTVDELAQAIITPRVPSSDPATRHRPPAEPQRSESDRPRRSIYGPTNAVSDAFTWADILAPVGWTHVGAGTVNGSPVELWRRPGDVASDYSLKASADGWAICWSSAAGLPGPGQRLTKWRVFVHLFHAGDEVGAARAIRNLARQDSR